jgi:hypothetical protein
MSKLVRLTTLDSMKKALLDKKEQRAKSRGRLDQLLDSLQAKYGVRQLVEARGKLVDLEREREKLNREVLAKESKLEKEVNAFIREIGKDD